MRSKLTAFSLICLLIGLAINGLYLSSLRPDASLRSWFFDSNVNNEQGCDFYALYLAADNFKKGKSIYLEDPDHKIVPCYFFYRYLPVGVAVGLPFSAFKPQKAATLWVVFLELLVLINMGLLFYITPSDKLLGLGGLLILGGSPLYLELYMGQYSLLQATFIFAAFCADYTGRHKSFALAWGAGLCWKLNTWIATPALIRHKKFGTLAISAAVLLATSIPYMLVHPDAFDRFTFNLLPEQDGILTRGNHGLMALAILLLEKKIALSTLTWLVPGVVIAVALTVTFVGKRANFMDQICLWMSAYFLAYKHVWEHHYVMLAPILLILGVRYRGWFLLLPGILCFLPTPYFYANAAGWSGNWEVLYHSAKPAAAFLTFFYAALKSSRR